jgi:hypothetical protein
MVFFKDGDYVEVSKIYRENDSEASRGDRNRFSAMPSDIRHIERDLRAMMNERLEQIARGNKVAEIRDAVLRGDIPLRMSMAMVHSKTSYCWSGTLGWLRKYVPFVYREMVRYEDWESAKNSALYSEEYDVQVPWLEYNDYGTALAGLFAVVEVEAQTV